ncbi:MAG: MliC family protein [Patescibacteria group bacterium]
MKKNILIILALFILVALFWVVEESKNTEVSVPTTSNSKQVSKDTVIYTCDSGNTVVAAYHEGEVVDVKPGEMPVPTGSVDVSLNAADAITLKQTISGSGVRYVNSDESFVFWNKGNEAIIMRGNAMDLDYKNCVSK